MRDTLVTYGPLTLGALATAVLGIAAVVARRYAWLRAFLARAELEVRDVVLAVEQTYVDQVRAARSPSSPGGRALTEEEQREARARAVNRLLELLGVAAIERALRILGLPALPARAAVCRWADTKVEAMVKRLTLEQGGRP